MKFGLRCALWLAQWMSPAWAYRCARALGWFSYKLNLDAAQTTRVNLQSCFSHLSDAEIEQLCLHSLQQVPLLFFEFAQLAFWPLERLTGLIKDISGEDLLRDAFEAEEGVLLLVPHYGNWEILCAFLGVNYSVAALYDPPKVASLESVIVAARERYDGQMFPIDTAGMRSIFKTLKAGKLVAILPDQVPSRESGVHADFFGQPALTMTMTHKLIQRNQPRVLLGVVRRQFADGGGYGYRLEFQPVDEAVYADDPVQSARAVNAAIEQVVLGDISQYQWEYKRFKRPPQLGKTNIYRRQ